MLNFVVIDCIFSIFTITICYFIYCLLIICFAVVVGRGGGGFCCKGLLGVGFYFFNFFVVFFLFFFFYFFFVFFWGGGGGGGGGGGMYLVVGTFCQKYVWVQVKNSSIIIYLGWSGRGGGLMRKIVFVLFFNILIC